MLVGMLRPTSGQVLLLGKDIWAGREGVRHRRRPSFALNTVLDVFARDQAAGGARPTCRCLIRT